MNKARRNEIQKIIDDLASLKERVESVLSDEQTYFDDMPENFQNGERGASAQNAIDSLENAVSAIDDAFIGLEGAQDE